MTDIKQPPYWMRQTLGDLGRHEGFREFAYPDPLSKLHKMFPREKWGYVPASVIIAKVGGNPELGKPWTVGIGFTQGVNHNTRMGREFAYRKLESTVLEHLWVLDRVLPGWTKMPDAVKSVLANLAFNLGPRLFQFKTTIRMLKEGNYAAAGTNLQASLWYKQVGARARELVARLKTGRVEAKHLVN